MAISKIVYGSNTLIDLTGDTVTADSLLIGFIAHSAKGEVINGSVNVVEYHTGSSEPDNSIGEDGDLYLVVE